MSMGVVLHWQYPLQSPFTVLLSMANLLSPPSQCGTAEGHCRNDLWFYYIQHNSLHPPMVWKINWRPYPVLVTGLIQVGIFISCPFPINGGLQLVSLPGSGIPSSKDGFVGLCYQGPCHLMLWKDSLVHLSVFQPITSVCLRLNV